MRFKQALSRKLAAALSAVMILSTIAPTSVPVLAAAPDDVLVDSAAEYSLTDAGSEDLSTPAESSLAEESDALEVAEEELLTSEPASEETIVEAADIAAETGAEPAETVDVAEGGDAPEGFYTITIPREVSQNIIKSVTLVSWNEAEGQVSNNYCEWPIEATVSAGSVVSIDEVTLNGNWGKDDVELKYDATVISANTPGIDVNISEGISDNKIVPLSITKKTFTASVSLNIISGNVITGYTYEISDVSEALPYNQTISSLSQNVTDTIELTDARYIKLKDIKRAPSLDDKFKVTVNGTDVISDNTALEAYTKVLSDNAAFAEGFNVVAERTAFDGKATINIVSNNLISAITYELDDATGDAPIIKDKAEIEYTNKNKLKITGFVYKFPQAGVDVTIEGTKFEGEKVPSKLPEFDITGATLVLDNTGNKAEKNTRTVNFTLNLVSNNSITGFKYRLATPEWGSPVPVTVSNDKLEIKNILDAKSIEIYDITALKAGNSKAAYNAEGALKITHGGKTEYAYTGESNKYKIDFTKDTEEATLEFVPYKEITLSGNEFSAVSARYWLNGGAYDGANILFNMGKGGTQKVYVEPGVMTLSVSNIKLLSEKNYYFPKVENGSDELKPKYQSGSPSSYYDLGKFDDDATVKIGVKAFIVDDTDSSAVKVSVAPGKAAVTYSSLVQNNVTDQKLGLSENSVLINNPSYPLTMNFASDSKDPKYAYRVGKVSYEWFTGNGMEPKEDTESGTSGITVYSIDGNKVIQTLLEKGEFKVNVEQVDAVRSFTFALSDPSNAVKDATAADNGIYVVGINHGALPASKDVFYGTKLKIKAEMKPGFNLKSISINYAVLSENGIDALPKSDPVSVTDFNKAKDGYEIEMKGAGSTGTTVVFNVEEDYAADIAYADGSEIAVKNSKYQVNHQKKVAIQYKKGSAVQTAFNFKAVAGNQDISSNIVKKTDGTLELNPKDLAGKTVTVTLYAKDGKGDKTDASVRTFTLVIDKADAGITFKNSEETAQLGTTKQFKATVKGNIDAVAKVTPDDGPIVVFKDGALSFTTTRNTAKKAYTVDLVDKGTPSIKYATIKITVDAGEVEKAENSVKITGVSNRFVTVSLAPSKVDTKIDGLAYKVEIKVSGQTKSLYEDKTKYLPITTKAYSVEMFTAAAKADPAKKYMGDEKAEFTATATVVQLNVADDAFGTATKANEVGVGKASKEAKSLGKAGETFETKLKLKKAAGMSKVYTNMDADHAFKIDVVYSKNTGVQQYDSSRTTLTDKNGKKINATTYIDQDGFYSLSFHPVGLAAGDYTIEVFALEPDGIDVSAKIKVRVLQAIEGLSIEGTPKYIYKQANKKATVNLTAYDTTPEPDKITKKVLWSIEDVPDTATPISKFVGKGMVQIGEKNGKITIDKNFKPDGILSFNVVAKANDYQNNGGNPVKSDAQTIYIKSSTFSDIKLAFGGNEDAFDTTPDDLGNSYTVDQLFTAGDVGKYGYTTYVAAYEKSKEKGDIDYVPCKYSVAGAKLLDTQVKKVQDGDTGEEYTVTYAKIGFTKPGDVKITATATDNSGRALKGKDAKVVKVLSSVKDKGAKLGWGLYGDELIAKRLEGAADEKDVQISQNIVAEGDYMNLGLTGYYKDAQGEWTFSFANTNVTAKGAKVVKSYAYGNDMYRIYPTAETTVITVKNSDAKKRDFKITVKNELINKKANTTVKTEKKDYAKGGKTVIVNKSASIYSSIDFTDVGEFNAYNKVSVNNVKFTVSPGKKDDYALVTVLSNKNSTDDIEESIENSGGVSTDGNTYAFKLKDGGVFNIDFNYNGHNEGKFYVKPGTYALNVTPATSKDGVKFVATGKTVKVNIKAVKAPKANIKPKTNVKFTVSSGQIEKGALKNYIPKNFGTATQVDYEYVVNRNPAAEETLKGVNNKGTINNFFNYFEVDKAGKLTFVGNKYKASLKTELDPKDKADKLELAGYVPYRYQNLDGTVSTVYVKVAIKATDKLKK